MDEGIILLIESIDRRTAALRQDAETNHKVVRDALVATEREVKTALGEQARKYESAFQEILLTTQSIQTTMVKNSDCTTCQQKFVTKNEIKTIVGVIVAIVGAAEWALSRAGEWWQTH